MAKITINGKSFDPIKEPTPTNGSDISQSKYILIQTNPSLTNERRAELASLGVEILEYVPQYSYICRYEGANLQPIRSLRYIAWVGIYDRALKLRKELLESDGTPNEIDVVFHKDVDPAEFRQEIAVAAQVRPDDLQLSRHKARLTIRPELFPAVAEIDDVRHIEMVRQPDFLDSVAREILGVVAVNGNGGPAFEGEGQIVVVADSGFDIGKRDNVHPAFKANGESRVVQLYPLGRPPNTELNLPGQSNDPIGHGTHVAGLVLGDGESQTFGKIRGSAPKARLIVQSLLDENNKLKPPFDLRDLFMRPYDEFNARIHNNSWGNTPGKGVYDQDSFEVDDFIWKHRDFVVCFAAGNEGRDSTGDGTVDACSITSPGTAKNCITIGATESVRSEFNRTYGQEFHARFSVGPLAEDQMADNRDSVAAISSRGPTEDERIKPDLVAPGTFILSAKSRVFTGATIGDDSDFFFHSGTSMASPLVAGCVALVREYLDKSHGLKDPRAALVKALLINGAQSLSGQNGILPANEQGFGRVDMAATIEPFPPGVSVEFIEEATALVDQQAEGIRRPIEPGTSTLKVTLVWTDFPGPHLQNDLDLIVRAGGKERRGNREGFHEPSSADFDRANNVEQVIWDNVPAGEV